MRARFLIPITLIVAVSFGCKSPQSTQPAWGTSPSGLGVVDLVPGSGPLPRFTQTVVVEAIGWVEEKGQKGQVFLDTRKRGYPDIFPLGVGRVIKGWDEGLATMKQGGKRMLRVPPALGYAPNELGKDIPPGSTVIFELELVNLR